MAHYAILDSKNNVIKVIVGKNEDELLDGSICDWEKYYGGKRTSYNTRANVHLNGKTPFRKNFASLGGKYDEVRDAFISVKPFNSWVLDEETCCWVAPKKKPSDGYEYIWVEATQDWVLYTVHDDLVKV
jgi:hypothetical protein